MKSCTIYKRKRKLIIVCEHKTDAGYRALSEPIKVLEAWQDSAEVGAAVIEVLDSSLEGVPSRSTGQGIAQLILKSAGVKSWREFEAQTSECFAQMSSTTVELVPCIRTGDGTGMHLTDRSERCQSTPKDVGDGLLRTFARLEGNHAVN